MFLLSLENFLYEKWSLYTNYLKILMSSNNMICTGNNKVGSLNNETNKEPNAIGM